MRPTDCGDIRFEMRRPTGEDSSVGQLLKLIPNTLAKRAVTPMEVPEHSIVDDEHGVDAHFMMDLFLRDARTA